MTTLQRADGFGGGPRRRLFSPSGCREQVLAQSERSEVRRLWRPDGGTVIWKETIGPGALARRKHESGILERLADVPGVARLSDLRHPDAIVLVDDGGSLLAAVMQERPLPVSEILRIAVQLADIIAAIHARGVVHKDINPANVVVTDDGRPVLIDFDLATTFVEDRPGFLSYREIEGTLDYLPPEQTGRTGLPVDHRADLYALGATLYAVIAGRPLFEQDELRLIHDILLRVPAPLSQVRPDVPAALSEIVARLLEKEPGRRYQSAEGVARDLGRLAERPRERFRLGEWDFPLRLTPPSRLVGRDAEIGALRTAFEHALTGAVRAVLIGGAPGVGKSALVNELRQPAAARGGWHVSGKSDQFQNDAALGSVLQAVRGVGRLLLAEPKEVLAEVRQRLVTELAPNVGQVTAVLPEFAVLLGDEHDVPAGDRHEVTAGDRSEVPAGDPVAADLRLRHAIVALLRVVVSPHRPLVLVVDDLQWADPASLELFDAILTEPHLPGLLVIGAFRAQEVDPAHPLSAMMTRWQRLGVVGAPMELENLPQNEAGTLLGEMLRLPADRAAELAGVLHRWSGGNPYDTLELINALRRGNVLTLGASGWSWDEALIRDHVRQSDVVSILQDRIAALPYASRTLLDAMACLGGQTEVAQLTRALGVPADALLEQLTPPLEDGLLVMGEQHRTDVADTARVRFRHDRVQQAVLMGLDDPARKRLRLTLARRLASSPQDEVQAAEQYLAADPVTDRAERREVARLYAVAAASAVRAGNHFAAERFVAAAVDIVVDLGADGHDEQLLALRVRQNAALYTLGRLDEADAVYAAIEGGDPDPVHLAAALDTQLRSLAHRGQHQEALAAGLAFLSRFGLPPPGEDFPRYVAARCREVQAWAATLDLDADLARPEVDDPRLAATSRLLTRLLPFAFQLRQPMIGTWILLESWLLWMHHGPSPALVATLAAGDPPLALITGDFRVGYAIGRHVLAVGEARGYEPATSLARHRFSLQSMLWQEPLERVVEQARLAREGLVRGGDLQMAAATSFTILSGQLNAGRSVDSYAADIEDAVAFHDRTGNRYGAQSIVGHRQLAKALVGATAAPGAFDDATLRTDEHLARLGRSHLTDAPFHVYRAVAAAMFGDAAALEQHSAAAGPVGSPVPGYDAVLRTLVQALSFAEQLRRDPRPEPADALLAKLDLCRAWLAARAEDAPANFRHLVRLVDAERAWSVGDTIAALTAFDRGLRETEDLRHPWHRAMLLERSGLFHLAHGLEAGGRRLLRDARQAYLDWGATGKVAQLDAAYTFLRSGAVPYSVGGSRAGTMTLRSNSVSIDAIDTMAVLRVCQTLSSATDLNHLQAAVVEQLTSLTGAADVLLVVRDDDTGRWSVVAGDDVAATLDVEAAGERGLLPLTAFRYAERTREPVLVEDATRDDRFARDRYLSAVQRCSLLVVPVLHQDALRAMLVLSNRQTSGVFTTDRLDAVMLLTGQLVVSLNNALLYTSLERRVAERTRELAEANGKLEILSATDPLTGLANRRRFQVVLDGEWHRTGRTGCSFGVAMVDVDDFKKFNDHYGHQAGDECLRRIGAALVGSLRATDVACRYGGEEFIVILPDTDEEGARAAGERVRAAVAVLKLPHVEGMDGTVSVSVGVAISQALPWDSPDDLVARADAALYEAKRRGRNQVRCAAALPTVAS